MGSVVKAKVRELENITREGRSRSMRKEVVGCVQAMVGKNLFLVQFEDGKNKYMSSCLLHFFRKRRLIWMSQYLTLPKNKEVDCFLLMGILRLNNLQIKTPPI